MRTPISLLIVVSLLWLAPAAGAADLHLDAQDRAGPVTLDKLPDGRWRLTFPGGTVTVDQATADGWADKIHPPPPSAATELARGRPATSSTNWDSTFTPGAANDNSATTRWSSAAAASGEWWRVDLGQQASLSSVEIDWQNATASPYSIQVSDNGTTWTTAATQTQPGSTVGTVKTTFTASGRYVRVLQGGRGPTNCCYGMSFWEVRVYGTLTGPAPTPPPPATTGAEGDIRPTGVFDSGADNIMSSAINGDALAQGWFRHFERARVYQDVGWPATRAYALADHSWMPKGWTYRDAMVASYAPGMASNSAFHLRDQAGNPLYVNFNCGGGSCTQWAADLGNPAFRASYVDGLRSHAQASQGVFMDDVNFYLPQVVSNGNGQFVRPWNPRTNAPMTDAEWSGYMLQLVKDVKAAFPDPIEVVLNTIAWHGPGGLLGNPDAKAAFTVADGWEIEGVTIGDDVAAYQSTVDYMHSVGAFVIHEVSSDANYVAAIYLCFNAGKDYIGHGSMGQTGPWPALWDKNLGSATSACTKNGDVYSRSFTNGSVVANVVAHTGTVTGG